MRRTAVIAAGSLAAVLLLAGLLCAAALIGGNTVSGRHLIENVTARLTHGTVLLSGLGGSFPDAPTLQRLQLRDHAGVWLQATDLAVHWSPLALLTWHVEIQTAHAASLSWDRLPLSSSPPSGRHDHSMPHIDVGQLAVDRVALGARLAGSPTLLQVHGSAHLRSVTDMTFAANASRIGGLGSYILQLQFDAARMDGTLKLQEPAHGPLENLLGYPGLGALSATASLRGPRDAERIDLQLDAGTLHVGVAGSVDLKQRSGDLTTTLTAAAMRPRPQLGWQRLQLQGRWQGSLSAPRATAQLRIEALELPDGLKLTALNVTVNAIGGALGARGQLEGLVLPGPRPRLLQGAPLAVSGSVRLDQASLPFEISASHALLRVSARGTAGRARRSADLDLSFPDLAALATVTAVPLRGSATARAHLLLSGDELQIEARAQGRLIPSAAAWSAALGPTPALQFTGSVRPGSVRIDKLSANGRALALSLSGRVPVGAAGRRAALQASGSLSLPDLAVLSPALAGKLNVTAKASGTLAAVDLTAQVTTTVSVHGSPPGSITASLKASGLPRAPSGEMLAQGSLDGSPVQLQIQALRGPDGVVQALIRRATWKSMHAQADLTSGTDLGDAHGSLSFAAPRLQDLQHLLGINISGSLDGTLSMAPAATGSAGHLHLQLHDLVTDALSANATLTGNGPLDAFDLDLSVQSSSVAGGPASVSSKAVLDAAARTLTLQQLMAQVHEISLRLQQPAKIDFSDGLQLTRLQLQAGGATLSVAGRLLPALDLNLALHDVTPALVNAVRPDLLAAGRGTLDARLTGTLAAPLGRVQLDLTGARIAGEAAGGLPGADLTSTVELMGDHAQLSGKLSAGKGSQLRVAGAVPLRGRGAFDLALQGTVDVAMINPMLEAHGRQAGGTLSVDARVTGSSAAPTVSGSVKLAQGTLHDYQHGIDLSDITGTLQGTQDQLRISSLTAKAAAGTIAITGTIGVLQHDMPVNLHLTAKNARPISSSIVTADLNADLQLTGTARRQLRLQGTVSVNRANIVIPNKFPPNVAVLDVRRPGQAVLANSSSGPVIVLDVRVKAPRQILISGRGLNAELGGEIDVSGTAAMPVVTGGFDLQSGIFSLASSRLTFSSGRVSFAGTGLRGRIDPTLNFTAQSTVADTTVTLHIGGFADAPQFQLTSVPPLPQDEIMARLLFGESASQLTALQAAEIGAALTTLAGTGTGLNPLVQLQKRLGLDRLTVGSNDTGTTATTQNSGATIEAGRYVSNRIFVDLKQDTTGSTQLEVDVDLTQHLRLQTRLGDGTATVQGTTPENDPGSSLGLSYRFEY